MKKHSEILFFMAFVIILTTTTGCVKKNTTANAISSEPPAPPLICPDYYHLKTPQEAVTEEKSTLNSPDGTICSDGKPYCYATGQKPILIPTHTDDWECLEVTNELDTDQLYPYCSCGATRHNSESPKRREWVCVNESCLCGETPCPEGGICRNGVCETTPQSDQAICDLQDCDYTRYYPEYKGDPAEDKSSFVNYVRTYPCGDTWLTSYSNRYCLPHPAGDMVMHSICPIKPGPTIGGTINDVTIDEASQSISIFIDDEAISYMRRKMMKFAQPDRDTCECGNEWCASDTACYQGHCVDIATLKTLPPGGYRWMYGRPVCAEESCTCGQNTCHTGEWCLEDRCFDTPDVIKVGDQYIKYGQYAFTITDKTFEDETIPREKFDMLDELEWLDVVTHPYSAKCEESIIPPNVEDYVCVIDKIDNACMEGAEDTYSFKGYHCMKDEGCDCGSTKCDKFARCFMGEQCLYDSIYLAMACNVDYNLWGFSGGEGKIYTDENGWCHCGLSSIPPYPSGYTCFPLNGMECQMESGCACGNTTCKQWDYCIKPDTCVESLIDYKDANNLWDNPEDEEDEDEYEEDSNEAEED